MLIITDELCVIDITGAGGYVVNEPNSAGYCSKLQFD